jgi:hypothetical protein
VHASATKSFANTRHFFRKDQPTTMRGIAIFVVLCLCSWCWCEVSGKDATVSRIQSGLVKRDNECPLWSNCIECLDDPDCGWYDLSLDGSCIPDAHSVAVGVQILNDVY